MVATEQLVSSQREVAHAKTVTRALQALDALYAIAEGQVVDGGPQAFARRVLHLEPLTTPSQGVS